MAKYVFYFQSSRRIHGLLIKLGFDYRDLKHLEGTSNSLLFVIKFDVLCMCKDNPILIKNLNFLVTQLPGN